MESEIEICCDIVCEPYDPKAGSWVVYCHDPHAPNDPMIPSQNQRIWYWNLMWYGLWTIWSQGRIMSVYGHDPHAPNDPMIPSQNQRIWDWNLMWYGLWTIWSQGGIMSVYGHEPYDPNDPMIPSQINGIWDWNLMWYGLWTLWSPCTQWSHDPKQKIWHLRLNRKMNPIIARMEHELK